MGPKAHEEYKINITFHQRDDKITIKYGIFMYSVPNCSNLD